MLALWCCHHECTDITELESKCGIPHGISYEPKTTGSSDSDEQEGEGFLKLFKEVLPLEMKFECIARTGFHALANTELWIKDPVLLSGHHVRRDCSRAVGCTKRQNFFLATDTFHLRISGGGQFNDPIPWTGEEKRCMEQVFGRVNRYPCFHYRRNVDFQDKITFLGEEEVSERWRLFGRSVGTTIEPGSYEDTFLQNVPDLAPVYSTPPPPRLSGATVLEQAPRYDIKLERSPGIYYWELVNYNHEEVLGTLQGDGSSRQRRLFIDPEDPSHTKIAPENRFSKKKKLYMSLIYRRVTHPSKEGCDRYRVIKEGGAVRYRIVGNRKCIYFSFRDRNTAVETLVMEPDREQPYSKIDVFCNYGVTMWANPGLKPQKIYQHVSTPMVGLRLYKYMDKQKPGQVLYYRLSMPPYVNIFSFEANHTSVRVNLVCDVAEMPEERYRALVGTSLVRAVKQPWPDVYCFRTHVYECMDLLAADRDCHSSVFKTFYM